MSTDYLAPLTEELVAAWYRRLADAVALKTINGNEPLASQFLKAWLDNGRLQQKTIIFTAPDHLKNSSYIKDGLKFHRRVFLTEEKARLDSGDKWAGIIPRIKDGRWNMATPLEMTYQSLIEVGTGMADIGRIQLTGTDEERDLFTSLRGFQLKSSVRVSKGKATNSTLTRILFDSWKCQVFDRYDFAYNEHLTVPNPDYQSTASDAVRPQDEKLRVYHKNAKRIEDKNLAKPYDLEMEWVVVDANITQFADINPNRVLN